VHGSTAAKQLEKTQLWKPFTPAGSESYTGTEARSLLREAAGNRLTEKP